MPQRPSRFKRRVALVEARHRESSGSLVQHAEPPAAARAPPIEPSRSQDTAGAIDDRRTSESPSIPKRGKDVAGTASVRSADYLNSNTEFDIPRSPTSRGPSLELGDHGAGGPEDEANTGERQMNTTITNRSQKKAGLAHTSRPKGLSNKSHGSSNTRKRRLPVNELALLRTTTSDGGLPDPGVRRVQAGARTYVSQTDKSARMLAISLPSQSRRRTLSKIVN